MDNFNVQDQQNESVENENIHFSATENVLDGPIKLLKNTWTIYKAKSKVIWEIFLPLILINLLKIGIGYAKFLENQPAIANGRDCKIYCVNVTLVG